jgi:dihydroorotase
LGLLASQRKEFGLMKRRLIRDAMVVNEGRTFRGHVLLEGELIADVIRAGAELPEADETTDVQGLVLLPGLIDDQVHFREPGLTHKADIESESRAAVAGGITSFMEMPNTVPNTLTQTLLEEKYARAAEVSPANYSFFMGASNENLDEVLKTDGRKVCGVKVFMGSSTGNMLVDNRETLEALFKECPLLIATHCEDEATVRANLALFKEKYGHMIPPSAHPLIRSEEACYKSSSMAVELATKHNTRLHILHISTARECGLFRNDIPTEQKRITSEACIHHLWFTDQEYAARGNRIKWNPAVKSEADREEIIRAVRDGRIDVIATDHAPHTAEEKSKPYLEAPSGGPLVQHSLVALMEMVSRGKLTLEEVAEKTAHAVARLFKIEKRGYIRPGYYADLVLVDPNKRQTVTRESLLYKCGWSPFEGDSFGASVHSTYVNGRCVYADGRVDTEARGMRMLFER